MGRLSVAQACAPAQLRLLVALILGAMVLRTPRIVWGDTFFNLVLGREIAENGLIHQNWLTREGYGATVVDLQWLAHWLIYRFEALFGVPGLALLAATLTSGALILAALFASARRAATPGRALLVGILALVSVTGQTVARAQTLTLPLVVVLAGVLAEDARAPSRRVLWLLPVTVLWANLHGSAPLAPALAALLVPSRALDAWRERRRMSLRDGARDVALVLALAACLWVSPYASGLVGYYTSTLGNAAFREYISEWHAPSLSGSPEAVLVLVWVGGLLPFAVRCLPSFELFACLSLFVLTLSSARHATPLALIATAFLPAVADRALGRHLVFAPDPMLKALARWLLPLGLVLFFAAVPWLALSTAEREFPVAFTDRVAQAARGARPVLCDETHADRLLWFHPELHGHVSHDARIETLPLTFLRALAETYAAPRSPRAQAWLRGYDLIVMDRRVQSTLWQSLRENREFHVLAEDRFATLFARRNTDALP